MFAELDDHMFIEREQMLIEADMREEMRAALEAEADEEESTEEVEADESNILSEEDAEKLIWAYIRSDSTGVRGDCIPW